MFQIVFGQNVILFIYLMIGCLMVALKKSSRDEVRGLSFLVLHVALTSSVFDSFQIAFSQEKLNMILYTFLITLIFIFLCAVISLSLSRVFRINIDKRSIWQCCVVFSNILFIGIPIVRSLYGEEGLIILVSFNTIFNIFLFSVGPSAYTGKIHFSLSKVIRTPAIIGMVIGFICFLLDFQVPDILGTPIRTLSMFTAPLSMVVNGIVFFGTPILVLLKRKDTIFFCISKLIILPLVVMVIFRPFIQNDMIFGMLVLIAAMPAGTANTVMAEEHHGKGKLASDYVVVSTLISLVTIPIMMTISSWL